MVRPKLAPKKGRPGRPLAASRAAQETEDALAKAFELLMTIKLVSVVLGTLHLAYSYVVSEAWPHEQIALFALDSAFFVVFYCADLVRFIHRFSVTVHLRDLVDEQRTLDREPVFAAARQQIWRRKLAVYVSCFLGVSINAYAAVRKLQTFSGIDLRLSEGVTLFLSLASVALYGWLFNYYRTSKTSEFTLEEEDEMFAALEEYSNSCCITSAGTQLMPDTSFTFRAVY